MAEEEEGEEEEEGTRAAAPPPLLCISPHPHPRVPSCLPGSWPPSLFLRQHGLKISAASLLSAKTRRPHHSDNADVIRVCARSLQLMRRQKEN